MPYQTVTLSTANIPGTSAPVACAWRNGAPISVMVYASTTAASTGVYTVQYTMDDLQLIGGSSLAYWTNYSSAPGVTGTVFQASAQTDAAATFISFLTPVAALRISSTANSSSGYIMKVIQGESW